MLGWRPPRIIKRKSAFQEEVQVHLPGHPHRAVRLHGHAGSDVGSGAGGDFGVGDAGTSGQGADGEFGGGGVDDGTGEFHLDLGGGNHVLDRLRRADGLTELDAVLGISHREVDATLGEADHFSRCEQCAAICGVAPIASDFGGGARGPLDREYTAEGIKALRTGQRHVARRNKVDIVTIGRQQRVGTVGIGDERIDRMANRHNCASQHLTQPTAIIIEPCQEGHHYPSLFDQRFRQANITCGLGNADQVHHSHAKAARVFGGEHAD